MYHDCEKPGFYPPEPPPHQHGPNTPMQSFPIQDNCNCGEPMGWEGSCATGGGRCAPAAEESKCTVVPPPIPPVRYVPGMNVQEQLCNMAERVNVCVNRWNQIQANCYQALDQVIGAAVNNDVYYAPDEVRYMEGYSEDAACSYSIVEARACDRSGKPIFCHLRPAFNNETNSGAREKITDVSFVTSAQVAMTAVQATETHWAGTTVFNGNPGASTPDDTVWVCGWNRNGVLRFFQGDVGECVLRQNRMVDCIGPVFPVLKDCKEFTEVLGSMNQEPGSIQAMGWKPNGNKVFFNCSVQDQPGMTPMQVTKVLQGMGCATAVITSYQTSVVSQWSASPIAGTESSLTYGTDRRSVEVGVPGMTGGMTFLGRLTAAPLQWSIPANCAAWVITKRPCRGWKNSFTTEVANVVQRLGNQENSMNSILGQIEAENSAISQLQYQVTQNTNNISELTVKVDSFDGRISATETAIDKLEQDVQKNAGDIAQLRADLDSEVSTRERQYNELTQADAQEKAERQAADAALSAAIKAEESARKSADTVLQNNIEEEALKRQAADSEILADLDDERKVRAEADQNITNALEAEISARKTKDAQHEAQMEALAAQEQKDHAAQQAEIDALKDGSGLPIATTTKLGAIIVGENLRITEEGVLSATGGGSGGGDSVVAGGGILITRNEQGDKVVSIDNNVVATDDELDALKQKVSILQAETNKNIAEIDKRDDSQDQEIKDLGDSITNIVNNINTIDGEVKELGDSVTNITQEITNIKNGSALPIASADTLGAVKIGANLSISEDGTLSASAGQGDVGETVAQGNGISVEHNTETNVATVSLSAEVQASIASIANKADKTALDNLATTVAGKADKSVVNAMKENVETNTTDIAELKEDVNGLKNSVETNTNNITTLQTNVTNLFNRANNADNKNDEQDVKISDLTTKVASIETGNEMVNARLDELETEAADLQTSVDDKVSKIGDTMTGDLTVPAILAPHSTEIGYHVIDFKMSKITVGTVKQVIEQEDGTKVYITDPAYVTGVKTPVDTYDAANKNYVDTGINKVNSTLNNYLPIVGGVMTGAIAMSSNKISGLAAGSESADAVNLGQVVTMIQEAVTASWNKDYTG